MGPGNPLFLFSQQRASVPPGRPPASGSGRAFSVNRVVFLFSFWHNNSGLQAPHPGPGYHQPHGPPEEILQGSQLPETRPQEEAGHRNSLVPVPWARWEAGPALGPPRVGGGCTELVTPWGLAGPYGSQGPPGSTWGRGPGLRPCRDRPGGSGRVQGLPPGWRGPLAELLPLDGQAGGR